MKKAVIILIIFALLAGGNRQSLYAQFKIPTGFSELKDSPAGRPMKRIYIDFDGDGKKDTATVIEKNNSQLQCYFLIYLTGSNKNHIIKMFGSNDYVYPMPLSVKKNVIQFEYFVVKYYRAFKLRYNHTKQKIQLIGYDTGIQDYTTSYNLLTGDYIVTNRSDKYIVTNNDDFKIVKRKEVHKGNKKMKAIFAEDIDENLLEQLDLVGYEFIRE